MNNTKLIQDFLDGRLDEENEDTLFDEIASNKMTREEFKSFLAIELALKNDSKTFIPPLSTTTGILTRIGFAIPGAIAGGAAVSSFGGKFEVLRTFSQGIYSALVSAVVTAVAVIGVYYVTDNNKEATNSNNKPATTIAPQISQNADLQNAQKEIATLQNKLNSITEKSQKPIIKYVYIQKKDDNFDSKNTNSQDNNIAENKIPETQIEVKEVKREELGNKALSINNTAFYNVLDPVRFNNSEFKGTPSVFNRNNYEFGNYKASTEFGLGIELRGLQEWSTKIAAVRESTSPKFSNMGITLSYDISDNFSILADARQEFFYQEYSGVDDLGNKNLYQQYPNFVSFSGGLRYSFLNLENVSAFGQAAVGGNNAGVVGRAMLGLEILPYNNYSFFIGIEGSMMDYFHKENRFQTSKLGLNYGIKFNL
jgi:hypothetical protein